MHCVTSYPVKDEEANLMVIQNLKKILKNVLLDILTTLLVRQLLLQQFHGALYIEKHFTISKNYSSFRDHKLSSDPEEMKEMVLNIRRLEKLMGSDVKEFKNLRNTI